MPPACEAAYFRGLPPLPPPRSFFFFLVFLFSNVLILGSNFLSSFFLSCVEGVMRGSATNDLRPHHLLVWQFVSLLTQLFLFAFAFSQWVFAQYSTARRFLGRDLSRFELDSVVQKKSPLRTCCATEVHFIFAIVFAPAAAIWGIHAMVIM